MKKAIYTDKYFLCGLIGSAEGASTGERSASPRLIAGHVPGPTPVQPGRGVPMTRPGPAIRAVGTRHENDHLDIWLP